MEANITEEQLKETHNLATIDAVTTEGISPGTVTITIPEIDGDEEVYNFFENEEYFVYGRTESELAEGTLQGQVLFNSEQLSGALTISSTYLKSVAMDDLSHLRSVAELVRFLEWAADNEGIRNVSLITTTCPEKNLPHVKNKNSLKGAIEEITAQIRECLNEALILNNQIITWNLGGYFKRWIKFVTHPQARSDFENRELRLDCSQVYEKMANFSTKYENVGANTKLARDKMQEFKSALHGVNTDADDKIERNNEERETKRNTIAKETENISKIDETTNKRQEDYKKAKKREERRLKKMSNSLDILRYKFLSLFTGIPVDEYTKRKYISAKYDTIIASEVLENQKLYGETTKANIFSRIDELKKDIQNLTMDTKGKEILITHINELNQQMRCLQSSWDRYHQHCTVTKVLVDDLSSYVDRFVTETDNNASIKDLSETVLNVFSRSTALEAASKVYLDVWNTHVKSTLDYDGEQKAWDQIQGQLQTQRQEMNTFLNIHSEFILGEIQDSIKDFATPYMPNDELKITC